MTVTSAAVSACSPRRVAAQLGVQQLEAQLKSKSDSVDRRMQSGSGDVSLRGTCTVATKHGKAADKDEDEDGDGAGPLHVAVRDALLKDAGRHRRVTCDA